MKAIRLFLVLAILPLASNCLVLSGRCMYELRNALAFGRVTFTATDSVYVQLQENEQRDYQPDKDFSWQITGASLKGHVQKIVLLPAGSSTPRYDFPISGDNVPSLSSGAVSQSEGADINGFYDLLTSGTAVVRITTDIPGLTTINVTLQNVQKTDWNRPYCS